MDIIKSEFPMQMTETFAVGPAKEMSSVHLGKEGLKFHDEALMKTNQGFDIKLSQKSYGGTFIDALSHDKDKVRVESLVKKDGKISWLDSENTEGRARVYADWGNLDKLGGVSISEIFAKVANPGIKYGFVRVTDKTSGVAKIFAVGAHFDGKSDDWRVRSAYFEVTINQQANPPQIEQNSSG